MREIQIEKVALRNLVSDAKQELAPCLGRLDSFPGIIPNSPAP